ncbi:neuronal acetylcholine receptor subunit alpha-9-II-like [Cherax quadricarinatus]|uniref:neuronal acetylcholine receptor subunit alpha-9-II-like n=1 Tax=Cherax quadricarinatus TaxID=27406 RepID=UPI00387EC99B
MINIPQLGSSSNIVTVSVILLQQLLYGSECITLVYRADNNYESSLISTNVIINHNGTCKLQSHAVFTSVCNVDIQWFPFDQQRCDMTFGSWTSDSHQMKLVPGPNDISRFTQNQEFFLENFYSNEKNYSNPCCQTPFSMVVYDIQLQRRVKFALFFFIIPGALMNICALMVFSLPAESGEKIGLSINSMLAMMVFLMAMIGNLPPTEKLPLAGVYYGVCLFVLTLNVSFSVYVLNLNHSGDEGYPVPRWSRSFTLRCSRLLRIKVPKFIIKAWNLDANLKVRKTKVKPYNDNHDEDDDDEECDEVENRMRDMQIHVIKVKSDGADMFKVLYLPDQFQRRSLQALEGIQCLMSRQVSMQKRKTRKFLLKEEWQYVSRVMDRVLLVIFFIGTLLFHAIMLSQSPYGASFEYCSLGYGKCKNKH